MGDRHPSPPRSPPPSPPPRNRSQGRSNRAMPSEHRSSFTREEISRIKELLGQKSRVQAEPKTLRQKLRAMDFYITDYADDQSGFTATDVDVLIERGTIKVVD